MTKNDQINFVKAITQSIQDKIVQQIEDNKIPESWNGIELRWLLAENFNRATSQYNKGLKRKYNNTVIVNDL